MRRALTLKKLLIDAKRLKKVLEFIKKTCNRWLHVSKDHNNNTDYDNDNKRKKETYPQSF